jgi:hypothetical protein
LSRSKPNYSEQEPFSADRQLLRLLINSHNSSSPSDFLLFGYPEKKLKPEKMKLAFFFNALALAQEVFEETTTTLEGKIFKL